MLKKAQRKENNSINAGSMADIAFLLLIFFLVTTQITEDKGILVKLPPFEKEPPPKSQIPPRNLFNVFVNANNELLVEDELAQISDLRVRAKEFIANPQQLKSLPKSPRNAVISLQNDRSTNYKTYIGVYNELKGAYNELRDERSLKIYNKTFTELSKEQKKEIKKEIPMIISEAEPTAY